jgi:hypothetical protein
VPNSNHVPGYREFYSRTAINRLTEALGSSTNPYPLTLLEAAANSKKGLLASNNNPRDLKKVRDALDEAERVSNSTEFAGVFGHISAVSGSKYPSVRAKEKLTQLEG